MNRLLKSFIFGTISLAFLFVSVLPADAYVNVRGYYRKDGTYVRPHVRSDPNGLKYDNYGWTPSQGLYNPTYGTRGSTWDTPTYITDPDYYEGKSLYEQGKTGSYIPAAPSIQSPSKVTLPITNPSNSYVIGSNWYCNSGYKKNGDICEKVIIPSNAYVVGSSWYCSNGYKKFGTKCEKVIVPPNAYVVGSQWYCNNGYKRVYDICEKIYNPLHSYIVGSNWYCEYGYERVGTSCQLK